MLALLADFKGVAEAHVELRLVVQVVAAKLAGLEDGKKLRVPRKNRVGAKISGGFERLVLQNGRARRLQSVVVLQSEANGFLDGDARRGRLRGGRPGRRSCRSRRLLLRGYKARGGQQGQAPCQTFSHVDTPHASQP